MKKLFYILFTASALLFVSCAKEVGENKTAPEAELTGETITFSATIDMPAATRAALSGLNINWQSGDYVAFATDNDATIRVYPVTVDGVDPTKCTITVDKVDGASGYYAIFKGSLGDGGAGVNSVDADDYSMVTFNTTTKTFSGLTVGNQQVAKNSLSSYLWYSDGYPLAMAGKADGSSLSMKPCLALVSLGIDAESVPAGYYYQNIPYVSSYSVNHDHYYTAVRGFNLYQKSGSKIYSSGDYDVAISADGSLTTTVVDNANKKEYRNLGGEGKMEVGTQYLMCLIPGGSVSSFKIEFLGWSANSSSSYSYSAAYTMTKGGLSSINPGDYYDLGVLNPLGRKQAKNEADDELADAASAYTPAIDIDGDYDDWDGKTEYAGTRPGGGSNSRVSAWRMYADAYNMFFYVKLFTEKMTTSRYLYVGFDTDNNEATGETLGGISGMEKFVVTYPVKNGTSPIELIEGTDPRSTVNGSTDGSIALWGVFDSGDPSTSTYTEVELCIPRSKVSLTSAGTISVAVAYNDYSTIKQSLTLN